MLTLFSFASRVGIGLILCVAGVSKLVFRVDFNRVLHSYKIFSQSIVVVLTTLVPLVELVFGILLLTGKYKTLSGTLAIGLFCTFSVFLAINILHGRKELECGCFGKHGMTIGWNLVARNCVMALVTFFGVTNW